MALKINLKPGERIVVNGAVLENADRRTDLLVRNRASILRQKDIMQPEEVTSPARHIYFQVMMTYLDPDGREEHQARFLQRLTEFIDAISSPDGLRLCARIGEHVAEGAYYPALVACRKLIDFEKERLGQ